MTERPFLFFPPILSLQVNVHARTLRRFGLYSSILGLKGAGSLLWTSHSDPVDRVLLGCSKNIRLCRFRAFRLRVRGSSRPVVVVDGPCTVPSPLAGLPVPRFLVEWRDLPIPGSVSSRFWGPKGLVGTLRLICHHPVSSPTDWK